MLRSRIRHLQHGCQPRHRRYADDLLAEATPKIGAKYVSALRSQFGAAILEESWQAADQVTLTVELNYLPEIVETVYYRLGGWLSTVVGSDERPLNGHFAIYYVLSVEGGDENGGRPMKRPTL